MRASRVVLAILIAWFLILITGHYLDQQPLWNDEQCVVNNIVQLTPTDIFTRPLLNDQEFPRLYLWLIQQFSKHFHQSLLSLRLFPFLAMLGACFVWFNIGRRVLGEGWNLVLFTGCWCASMPLVYYAAELKSYSMDVLACGLIVLFLLEQKKLQSAPSIYRAILLLLPLLGLWSYAAIFLLLLPLYALVRDSFAQRRWLVELSLYIGSLGLVLGLLYFFDLRVSATHLMGEVWHDYFILLDSSKDFFNSLGKGLNNMIGRRFAERPVWVKGPSRGFMGMGLMYMLAAGWGWFKKDGFALHSIVPITLSLFLIQLILAVLQIYPLAVPRMSLFFSPLLFLCAILALSSILKCCKVLGMIFQLLFAVYLVYISLGIGWDVLVNQDLGSWSMLYSSRAA